MNTKLVVFVFLGLLILSLSSGIAAQENPPFHLGELGSYVTGWRGTNYLDASRDNRRVLLRIIYPALGTPVMSGDPIQEAEPDLSGAPYPLILAANDETDLFDLHLPTHGFVVATIINVGTYSEPGYNNNLIDYPLDLLFALEQLSTNPPEQLAGMIDTEHVGVVGYSVNSAYTLMLGGARIDPELFHSVCTPPNLEALGYPAYWNDYTCQAFADWDAFVDHAGSAITATEDGLWQAITDDRIRAIAPGGAEGMLIFGERGLAAVDRPTLMLSGNLDDANPYQLETVPIFELLGTEDKTLITFLGQGHAMIINPDTSQQMRHFYTAFFGYYLQGREDYADFFNEAYVNQFSEELAWGELA